MAAPTPNNLLQLQGAAKSFGSKQLFSDATFSINENEHIGVIGPNGAGKTSLFKILAGELDLDHGEVIKSRQLSMGYLRQHDTWNENDTLETYLSQSDRTQLWEIKKWGHDLGLSEEKFASPIKALSGGYRMRAKLLHLLAEQPNLMMLDEPTNYLDLETLLVLEEFLQNYEGAFLLISHDREFLRRTTDHILEIEAGEFTKYSGNIDDYFEQKELLRSQLEKQAMTAQAKKDQILAFAARFGAKASKARQVQSRIKQMNKMETIELKPIPNAAKIHIPAPTHTGKIAMEIHDADLGYPEKMVLGQVSVKIATGDHLGIVGFNGAGKSTFLKSIAKELEPLFGSIEWGYQVSASYYAQHVAERLKAEKTVYESLSEAAHPDVRPQEVLAMAGSLLFSGDNVKKKIKVLSGGEKARVALGQILLKKSPVLLLDEPTNHLDFYTVEGLTQALESYKGTIVVVSHDRGFVGRIANKILEVRSGRLLLYPGTYEEYVWSVQQRRLAGEDFTVESPSPSPRVKAATPVKEIAPSAPVISVAKAGLSRDEKKALEAERRVHDKTLQDIDRKTKAIESRMAEQSTELEKVSGTRAAEISRELSAAQRKLQELEQDFLRAMEAREKVLAALDGKD